MSQVLIEKYRGFDICFDTFNEIFCCVCTEDNKKESKSFNAVKIFIDEYLKENSSFTPFWVEPTPNSWKKGKIQVVGIRKDKKLVIENEDGNKTSLSKYDLGSYMISKPKNKKYLDDLRGLEDKEHNFNLEIKKQKEKTISMMDIVTLEDYMKDKL